MTEQGLKEWRRFHCSLLCIHHPDYEKMLDEAGCVFRKMGCTVEELDAATLWLWERPEEVERPWGTHGGILRRCVMIARRNAKAAIELERIRKHERSTPASAFNFADMLAKRLPKVKSEDEP